jgi:hypothetical protein
MRLDVLDRGHSLGAKAMFAMIRVVTGRRAPDVIKTLMYRPEFFGAPMRELFQATLRGAASWSVGDRELMAAFVSKTNECEF